MTTRKCKTLIFLGVLAAVSTIRPRSASAETLSFGQVWREVSSQSPALEGAKLKTEAAEAALSRSKRHWLPKLYLDARAFQTNDPGANLIGMLEQRQITAGDFSPDSLNHPEARTFTRGALGLDLPLYEGGLKQAESGMHGNLSNMEKFEATQSAVDLYSRSVVAYGAIASAQRQVAKLKDLNETITRLMKGYELGQRSNPVGYSGLLGMKSLANRINGVIAQTEAQEQASQAALRELGLSKTGWSPQLLDVRAFTAQYLPIDVNNKAESSAMSAKIEGAKALSRASAMERARFLPRAGAFAESYLFKGERDSANGYTAGIYLQMSLFDPADFGKHREARLKSQAALKMAEAGTRFENAERESLRQSENALRANLVLLEDSEKLLADQTRVSSTLFKNGSMSVLQFVEILNRRADLIVQQGQAELGLLTTSASLAQKTQFSIPQDSQLGDKK